MVTLSRTGIHPPHNLRPLSSVLEMLNLLMTGTHPPQESENFAKPSHITPAVDDTWQSIHSSSKSSSNGPDFCPLSDSNPDKNYYHIANWDTDKNGNFYYNGPQNLLLPHDEDYHSTNKSYCGEQPSEDEPAPLT